MALAQATASAVTVTTTSETAAVVTPALPVSPPGASTGIAIRGNINITAGTGATFVTIKVRQGSGTGGTAIYTGTPVTVVAAAVYDLAFEAIDTSAVPASQYTVTVTQTAASGNGTVNQAEIEIDLVVP